MSGSPWPSSSSFITVEATLLGTTSPAARNSCVMVLMYHEGLGAKRSARSFTRVISRIWKYSSLVVFKKSSILSITTCTLFSLLIANSRSIALRFSASSSLDRQFITAIWWFAATVGFSFTISPSAFRPRYFRFGTGLLMKNAVALLAASSRLLFG